MVVSNLQLGRDAQNMTRIRRWNERHGWYRRVGGTHTHTRPRTWAPEVCLQQHRAMPEQTIGLQAVQRKALRRTRSRIGMPIVGLSTGDDAISVGIRQSSRSGFGNPSNSLHSKAIRRDKCSLPIL